VTDFKKILCGIDFSDTSRAGMRAASALAGRLDADLTLFHVFQAPGYVLPEGVVFAGPDVLARVAEEVDKALAAWKVEAEAAGAKRVTTQSAMGTPADEIVMAAQKGGYDLIVVGTHGRSGIVHALLGSIAEKVVRRSTVPVLTVHPTSA
jgi:nucleotide-binding universal stress UspA family protein